MNYKKNDRYTYDDYKKDLSKQFLDMLDPEHKYHDVDPNHVPEKEDDMNWVRSWSIMGNPTSFSSGNEYRGVNAFALSIATVVKGYEDNRWITYNQARKQNGHIKAGEHGTKIVKYKAKDIGDESYPTHGKILEWKEVERMIKEEGREMDDFRPVVYFDTVFNIAQCEGIPLKKPELHEGIDQDKLVTDISKSMGVPITNDGGDRAYYAPYNDSIHLPEKERFTTSYAYNATALHELSHAGGSASRLNRQFGVFGDESYAYEELVAEMSSCLISGLLAPDNEALNEYIEQHSGNHKAYVKSWAEAISKEPDYLLNAIKQANESVDFLEVHGGIKTMEEFNRNKNHTVKLVKTENGIEVSGSPVFVIDNDTYLVTRNGREILNFGNVKDTILEDWKKSGRWEGIVDSFDRSEAVGRDVLSLYARDEANVLVAVSGLSLKEQDSIAFEMALALAESLSKEANDEILDMMLGTQRELC